jgi:methylglyoxal synthase
MKKNNIALVAHDARKKELIEWCLYNAEKLRQHNLFATGTTGELIKNAEDCDEELMDDCLYHFYKPFENNVTKLLSGPLGGDQQIGAMIAEGKIDCLIFFCDNLITQGHQQDVAALVRLASLYNIAFATNRTTADMIITSSLIDDEDYKRIIPAAINNYKNRTI